MRCQSKEMIYFEYNRWGVYRGIEEGVGKSLKIRVREAWEIET